jgi:hypothetical protein
MNLFQILVLGGLVLVLVLGALILAELRKFGKIRKPVLAFAKTGTKAMEVPVRVAELTEKHMAEITSIAGNAVLSHDVMEAEWRRREDHKAALAAKLPPPAIKETGTVAVETNVPQPALFGEGANGGAAVEIKGRVDMGGPPPASPDADRPLQLGARSTPDGTG